MLMEPIKVLSSPDGSKHFIAVVKNASMTMRMVLADQYGWAYNQFDKCTPLPEGRYFSFIRNPLDRWVSGMVQDFGLENVELGDPHTYLKASSHTQPQHLYFEGVHPTLVRFDTFDKIWGYLDEPKNDFHFNEMPDVSSCRAMFAKLKAWGLANMAALREAYVIDFTLYEAQ